MNVASHKGCIPKWKVKMCVLRVNVKSTHKSTVEMYRYYVLDVSVICVYARGVNGGAFRLLLYTVHVSVLL